MKPKRSSLLWILTAALTLVACITYDGNILSSPVAFAKPTNGFSVFLPVLLAGNVEPPPIPNISANEWIQDGHDSQRTSYTSEDPELPWRLLWTWNGADSDGGSDEHFYDAPRDARTITGGQFVYVPAGDEGLFALRKTDGQIGWHLSSTSFNITPAYDPDSGYLFAGGENGVLYKVNSDTGSVVKTYQAGSNINRSILLVDGYVYLTTDAGFLHKVDTGSLSRLWTYDAGEKIVTPAAYSFSKSVVVICTDDLYVHAVRATNGTQQWRVKPTPLSPGFPHTFDGSWPVVAEQHGIVFVRLNLGMESLWSGDGPGNMYPGTNAATRDYLLSNPQLKNLFALDLVSGQESFITAVGYGGVETVNNSVLELEVGTLPVIRVLSNGDEVAYQPFRNSQSDPPDGRWDSHLGEMVLDGTTIPGMVAGDLRFVQFDNSFIHITDEQCPMTMAGDTIFYAHWGASESMRITNRSSSLGLNYDHPITSNVRPTVIRRQQSCQDFDPVNHFTDCGLTLFGDGRYWAGPGFWTYWNVLDPPVDGIGGYDGGLMPRHTYVSDGLIIVGGNGGDLMVFQHSGETP